MNQITMLALAAALFTAGCASSGTDSAATANVVQAKPTFTDEEKANMTAEEKAGVYNETALAEERVVCRRQVVTGSHRKKTVCRTSAQIKADQDAAHEALRSTTRGGTLGGGGSGDGN